MLEKYLQIPFERFLLLPMARRLERTHIKPDILTFLACAAGLGAAWSIVHHGYLDGIFLILLSGYLDALDGFYARKTNQSTSLGGLYDVLSDRIVEAAVVIALFTVDPASRSLPALLMLASILICVTSFLLVGIYTKNSSTKGFYYSPGIIERPEAFVFFIAMLLMPQHFTLLAYSFTLLVLLTAKRRVKQFKDRNILDGNSLITPS